MSGTAEEHAGLCQGIHAFRAGDYFAAHDAWEEVWRGLHGRRRLFWQAMIQLAVGAYHLENGNRRGCESLWGKALQRCEDLTQMYAGEPPAPLAHLTPLLHRCLAALQQETAPRVHLTHFADAVLSEAWCSFA